MIWYKRRRNKEQIEESSRWFQWYILWFQAAFGRGFSFLTGWIIFYWWWCFWVFWFCVVGILFVHHQWAVDFSQLIFIRNFALGKAQFPKLLKLLNFVRNQRSNVFIENGGNGYLSCFDSTKYSLCLEHFKQFL